MNPSDLVGLAVSLVLSMFISIPVVKMIQKLGLNKFKGQRIVEEAKKAGRVAEGRLVNAKRSAYAPERGSHAARRRVWFVEYEYEVGRRTYRYRTQLTDDVDPPKVLRLYYLKGKPEKVVLENEELYSGRDMTIILSPVIIWLVLYFVFFK